MHCPIPNESTLDRLIRLVFAEAVFILGFFWLGGYWQVAAYFVSFVLLVTTVMGFCGLYKLLRWDTTKLAWKPNAKIVIPIFVAIYLVLAFAGGYASLFFSRKFFLEDYNAMNGYYKQVLFATGQNDRVNSKSNYTGFNAQFIKFTAKYSSYRPWVIRRDASFDSDMVNVGKIVQAIAPAIESGDLKQTHLELEKVRNVFQEMLKRNGFSMLAVYLVDFHDSMEKVIAAADAKDASSVINTYIEADGKLKDVETAANDDEIQAIRAKLEEVLMLAKQGKSDELAAKAAELKSSFVKVYLKRG